MKTKGFCFRIRSLALLGAVIANPSIAAASDWELGFKAEENDRWGWGVVNDGVMGGLSKGNLSFEEEGVMRFSGNLSLENNGGFSSVRSRRVELNLGGQEGLEMRVMGDGRTYQVRAGTDARYRGMEVSFMAEFPTEAGKWTEVRVPFGDFVGSFRGNQLPEEAFNPSKVERLGFLLADKKAGEFDLKVDWVRAYGKTCGQKDCKGMGDVVERALADGRFKTLAAALTKADLVDVLGGEGKFTVFAPTDEAFAKLPEGTVAELLKPENKDAVARIVMAIDKGVPLYNRGNVEGCAEVYAQCITGLVEDAQLDGNLRKILTAALEKSEGMERDDDRAWLFRRSLDATAVYLTLNQH